MLGEVVWRPRKGRRIRSGWVETYLAYTLEGISMRALGARLGIAGSTVMRRVQAVEEAREEPAFDAIVAQREAGWPSPAPAGAPITVRPIGGRSAAE